jgi:hypothetical protein
MNERAVVDALDALTIRADALVASQHRRFRYVVILYALVFLGFMSAGVQWWTISEVRHQRCEVTNETIATDKATWYFVLGLAEKTPQSAKFKAYIDTHYVQQKC